MAKAPHGGAVSVSRAGKEIRGHKWGNDKLRKPKYAFKAKKIKLGQTVKNKCYVNRYAYFLFLWTAEKKITQKNCDIENLLGIDQSS